jgi:hypothetical protein
MTTLLLRSSNILWSFSSTSSVVSSSTTASSSSSLSEDCSAEVQEPQTTQPLMKQVSMPISSSQHQISSQSKQQEQQQQQEQQSIPDIEDPASSQRVEPSRRRSNILHCDELTQTINKIKNSNTSSNNPEENIHSSKQPAALSPTNNNRGLGLPLTMNQSSRNTKDPVVGDPRLLHP